MDKIEKSKVKPKKKMNFSSIFNSKANEIKEEQPDIINKVNNIILDTI
jgi:hypothetical protein